MVLVLSHLFWTESAAELNKGPTTSLCECFVKDLPQFDVSNKLSWLIIQFNNMFLNEQVTTDFFFFQLCDYFYYILSARKEIWSVISKSKRRWLFKIHTLLMML